MCYVGITHGKKINCSMIEKWQFRPIIRHSPLIIVVSLEYNRFFVISKKVKYSGGEHKREKSDGGNHLNPEDYNPKAGTKKTAD